MDAMIVCAWCEALLTPRPAASGAAPVSHGLCPACLARQLLALRPAAPAPAR